MGLDLVLIALIGIESGLGPHGPGHGLGPTLKWSVVKAGRNVSTAARTMSNLLVFLFTNVSLCNCFFLLHILLN